MYLTPSTLPNTRECWAISIPTDLEILAAVRGALRELCFDHNWEQFGAVTVEEMTELFEDITRAFDNSRGTCVGIGQIVSQFETEAPYGWLVCDGSEAPQAEYPELYALWGDRFGAASAGNFKLPDMRGKVLSGSTSTVQPGNTGGNNSVSLGVDNLPPHSHTVHGHTGTLLTGELPGPVATVALPLMESTGVTGASLPVDVTNEFMAVVYVVRAK